MPNKPSSRPGPYEIAAWRFEQIASLIDPSLSKARRRAALRERTTKPVKRPWATDKKRRGKKKADKPIGKSTLYRWLAAYREHGYTGLLPKPREDRGKARHASTAAWVG